MSEKSLGLTLVILGVLVMSLTTFNVYQVFTSRAQPISLFHLPPLVLDMAPFMSGLVPNLPPNATFQTELLPSSAINDLANIFAHLMLAGFMLNAGYKLASLGVTLFRPIHVNLKQDK